MHASTAGLGLPEGIYHTSPTAPEVPDDLQPIPPPSTITYRTGNAISLAHRLADGRKNPATLIFLPQPTGSPCRAAAECEMDLLRRSTYHDYRAAVNSMQPMDLLFIPNGCLLFRDPASMASPCHRCLPASAWPYREYPSQPARTPRSHMRSSILSTPLSPPPSFMGTTTSLWLSPAVEPTVTRYTNYRSSFNRRSAFSMNDHI